MPITETAMYIITRVLLKRTQFCRCDGNSNGFMSFRPAVVNKWPHAPVEVLSGVLLDRQAFTITPSCPWTNLSTYRKPKTLSLDPQPKKLEHCRLKELAYRGASGLPKARPEVHHLVALQSETVNRRQQTAGTRKLAPCCPATRCATFGHIFLVGSVPIDPNYPAQLIGPSTWHCCRDWYRSPLTGHKASGQWSRSKLWLRKPSAQNTWGRVLQDEVRVRVRVGDGREWQEVIGSDEVGKKATPTGWESVAVAEAS